MRASAADALRFAARTLGAAKACAKRSVPTSASSSNRATVSISEPSAKPGWPYIQHRGGPKGFLRMLDDHTLAFADFRGNKQYISAGNVAGDDRTVLFLSGLSFANPARALRSRFASSSPMLIPNSSAPHRPRLRRPHRARVCV